MKKIKHISSFILILILAVSIKISGCEQEDLDFYIDCFDCLSNPPDSANLLVYVSINEENPHVPLILYKGDYEDNIEDYRDTAHIDTIYTYNNTTYTDTLEIWSEMGTYYSIKATYQIDGKPFAAVDGDRLRVVDGEGECSPPCYVIRGGTLDLRLKNEIISEN